MFIFVCEKKFQQKIETNKTFPGRWEPIAPLSANHTDKNPQVPTSLTDQKPSHLLKKKALQLFKYFTLNTGLKNIKLFVKSYFTRYDNV